MTSSTAFNPSTTVSFVVKNNSSIRRIIRVFNTKIFPGGTLDLMKIPGITEEDIRSEITKGNLKQLLANGSLAVVSSSTNFSSADVNQVSFLNSVGLSASNNAGFDPSSLSVTDWYIDPINGKDSNTGKTSSTALATFGALSRKWGVLQEFSSPTFKVTVHILNDLPDNDSLNFSVNLGPKTILLFQGEGPGGTLGISQVLDSGTLGNVVTRNRSTNTAWQASGSASFTANGLDVNYNVGNNPMCRTNDLTTDPTGQAYFWIVKDMGGGNGRLSEPLKFPGLGNSVTNTNRFTPVNGHSYQTVVCRSVSGGSMLVGGRRGGGGQRPQVVFKDLDIRNTNEAQIASGVVAFYYYGCSFERSIETTTALEHIYVNCAQVGANLGSFGSAKIACDGGAYYGCTPIPSNSFVFDLDVILDFCFGVIAGLNGQFTIGTMGIFDGQSGGPASLNPNGDGLGVYAGGSCAMTVLGDTTASIWGSGNSGAGINVFGGANFAYNTVTQNAGTQTGFFITGTGGNFQLGDQSVARAWNDTTGAYTEAGSPPSRTTTWANLAAAIGSSGFANVANHGMAINLAINASITPFSTS